MTKNRARGPRRKAPKSSVTAEVGKAPAPENSNAQSPSNVPEEVHQSATNDPPQANESASRKSSEPIMDKPQVEEGQGVTNPPQSKQDQAAEMQS